MDKKAVSKAEILALIAGELRNFPECANAWPHIFWHKKGGSFNWDVNIFSDSDADAEICNDRVRTMMDWLRARYQIFQPS